MMNRAHIEKAARELQKQIWQDRESLFPLGVPPPLVMFEPETAARVMGFDYQIVPRLGTWGAGRDQFEIAGMVDRQRNLIAVSNYFKYDTMRFTGAHEIGHVALNHPDRIMHRDRPVFDIAGARREHTEQEADYFAACFLAPAKVVLAEFKARFRIEPPLPLTDAVAFNLRGSGFHELLRAGPGSHEFASAVATTRHFNGRHFLPLVEVFGLSTSAMAIRLRELNLIDQ